MFHHNWDKRQKKERKSHELIIFQIFFQHF